MRRRSLLILAAAGASALVATGSAGAITPANGGDAGHLKSVPDADVGQVPAGWTQVFHETVAGTGYTTFYMLTPH